MLILTIDSLAWGFWGQRLPPPREPKMAAAAGYRCSTAATSGKDAARHPPPPPHMTSPCSPSQISGRSRREKNKPEPPEPAGFLRAPVRLLPSVSSFPTRRSLRRDEVAPVTSPGPLHPGQPAGREGEDYRLSMPILRYSIRQQGTIQKTAAPRWAPANPACFAGTGPGLLLLTLSVADASWGLPTHPAFRWLYSARKRRSDMASSTRQRQQQSMQLSYDQSEKQ